MRTKSFMVSVEVSSEFMESDQKAAVALAHATLRDRATEAIIGPRGGRYLPIGEAYGFRGGQTVDDVLRNVWSFVARVQAKYVRPTRRERAG